MPLFWMSGSTTSMIGCLPKWGNSSSHSTAIPSTKSYFHSSIWQDPASLCQELQECQKQEGTKGKGVVETATNTILNSQNLLEEQGLDLPQDLKAVCSTLLSLLLSFPLTMITTGHQTLYKGMPQTGKEPHGRCSRG